MKRRLFSLCSAGSMVLLVGVSVLWVRSYRVTDRFAWVRPRSSAAVASSRGQFCFEYAAVLNPGWVNPGVGPRHAAGESVLPPDRLARIRGLEVASSRFGFALVNGRRWGESYRALF